MPIQILMPALSPTMTEGNLARWLKKEGDVIKAGQVLAEIETDKATMEVEAVDEGKILKILVPAGAQGIKVNSPIAILAEEGEDGMTVEAAMAALAKKGGGVPSASKAPTANAPTQRSAPTQNFQSSRSAKVFASPLAKRIAEQNHVDLKQVNGSGPNGRIVRADIEAFIANARNRGGGMPQGIDAKDYATKLGMSYTAIPNSSVRKVIAKRLTEAKQLVPHFYLSIDCEIDALLAARKKYNEKNNSKVTLNDFIIRAVGLALKKVPAANASWTEEAILQYKEVDVSVAVASPNGLITPIIKKADKKPMLELSSEMRDLAGRAREGKLRPEEFQGGGFTISNLGMFGIKDFTAIINPPQSCILAIGAGEQRPVVKDGKLAIATLMTCTLSTDHRSVDGAVGAEFLAAFKLLIEKPDDLVA